MKISREMADRAGKGKSKNSKANVLMQAARWGMELLEPRLLMSTTDAWTNAAGGNWDSGGNWSLDHAPRSGNAAVISISTSSPITKSNASVDVFDSYSSNQPVVLSGGTMVISGTLGQSGSSFTLNGGTLEDATVSTSGGGQFILSGGILDGVTIAAGTTADATEYNPQITVQDDLTLNGTLDLGATDGSTYAYISFEGTQTLDGTGKVVLGGSGNDTLYAQGDGGSNPAALTIGSGITIDGVTGSISSYYTGDSVSNEGTINSDGGGTISLSGSWSNSGVMKATSGTLNLGGAFSTAGLGDIEADGGAVNLIGMLDNTGGTLTLNSITGSWNLAGGTILNGEINASGGSELVTLSGTLDHTTIDSGTVVDATTNYASITVLDSLVLNGTINLGATDGSSYSQLHFFGTESLEGGGNIEIGANGNNAIYAQGDGGDNPATLTIASGITIDGIAGNVGGYYANDTVVNNGLIATEGGAVNLSNVTNSGTIHAQSGGTISFSGDWSNSGEIIDDANINLGGAFTQSALGTFINNNATVNLTGTLSGDLSLDSSTGSWNLAGGTIQDGTISAADSTQLVVSYGTLDGVTIAGDATLNATTTYANINILDGLTLNGTLDLGASDSSNYSQFHFMGTQTLTGTGEIVFGSSNNNGLYAQGDNGSNAAILTIGDGIIIDGISGVVSGYYTGDQIVNEGLINSNSTGTISLGGEWTNTGSMEATNGVLGLGGSFSTSNIGDVRADGGSVEITGSLDNKNSTLTLNNTTGSWELTGGVISSGTLTTVGSAELILTGGGTLDGLTVSTGAVIDGTINYNSVTITDGLTLNGTIDAGASDGSTYCQLIFNGTQALNGSGNIVFGSWNNAISARGDGGDNPATLTIGSGITIDGSTGSVMGEYAGDTVVNAGKIGADVSGGTILLGGDWSNTGTVSASAGTLNLSGNFTTAGLGNIQADGGTVNITGTLDNSGHTLLLNATTGSWNLAGGTIFKGAINGASNIQLMITGNGTLDGVTIDAGTPISTANYGSLTILDGLTLNGTLDVGPADGSTYSQVYFNGTQTLAGSGTITFGGWDVDAVYAQGDGGDNPATLTIGSGIIINGGSGTVSGYYTGDGIINAGTINANTASGIISVAANGTSFANSGTLEADSGTLTIGNGAGSVSVGNGNLIVGIGGSNPGVDQGQINIAGNLALSGNFTVKLINGFVPSQSQTFTLVNYSSRSGSFASMNLAASGTTFTAAINSTNITVTAGPVIDAPPTASATENTSFVFSNAHENGITLGDTNALSNTEQLTLSVTHGVLDLATISGITFVSGADDSSAMTITGKLSSLNSAIAVLTYTPDTGYAGNATLSVNYLNRQNAQAASSSASITVVAVPPTAAGESYTTNENVALTVSAASGVLINDSAPAGESLSASLLTAPGHGTVTFDSNGDGGFIYTPANGYFGGDSFVYRATDTNGLTADATVNITVRQLVNLSGATFYLKLESGGDSVDVWNNNSGTGTVVGTYLLSETELIVSGSTGDDSFVMNFSNGTPLNGAGPAFVGSAGGHNVLNVVGANSTDQLSFTGSSLTFQAGAGSVGMSYSNLSAITFTGGSGSNTLDQLAQPAAGVVVSFANPTSSDSILVGAGTYRFPTPAGSGITVDQLGTLSISAGASAVMPMAASHANRMLLELSNLAIAGLTNHWQGLLDLGDNDLIVTGVSLSQIRNQFISEYNVGHWNGGGGITSSAAAGNSSHLTTLGITQNANGGTFDGQPSGVGDILIKYTYYGDADMSGTLNGGDYQQIDSGFGSHLTGWVEGDFNYDGVVDGSDFSLIDNAFNQTRASSAAPLAVEAQAESASSAPVKKQSAFSAAASGANSPAGPIFADSNADAWKLYIEDQSDSVLG